MMTARQAVYWWLYDNVDPIAAVRHSVWMAILESQTTMGEIAKRLNISTRQVWSIFDAENDPLLSTLALISSAIDCRLEMDLRTDQ